MRLLSRNKILLLLLNFLVFIVNFWFINKPAAKIHKTTLQKVNLKQQIYEPLIEVGQKDLIYIKNSSTINKHADNIINSNIKLKFSAKNKIHKIYFNGYRVPPIQTTSIVNCEKIFKGDENELSRGEKWMGENPKIPLSEQFYLESTKNCEDFKKQRGYVQHPLSMEEAQFPLAFSISSFRDIEQTERLLRSIYHPQNLYCIHIDTKSPIIFYQAIRSIANCFSNVWIASKLSRVKWGDISVIMSEINCMKDLLEHYRRKFKYFINLTGQEFPLRSNLELVKIAKIFNGSNDISGSSFRMEKGRVSHKWGHKWSHEYQQNVLHNTKIPKSPYPYNITLFKGETHGLFSVKMVEFIMESFHGRNFFEWCFDTAHASEHYWNTLNYNPQLSAPGRYIGDLKIADQYFLHPNIRAKNWVNLYREQWPCYGKVVRGLCIFSLRDLSWLANRPELFANKFHLSYQTLAYDCLEELQRNRTMLKSYFNSEYYLKLPTAIFSTKDGL